MWAIGGVGSGSRCASTCSFDGVVGGTVSIDWSALHELKMFPRVLCEVVGGLAGGDAKRADCSLVTG